MAPLVLLVDDYADAREMYGFYLARRGYRVEEAADGHEALAKALSLTPDIILMDLSLPGIDELGTHANPEERHAHGGDPDRRPHGARAQWRAGAGSRRRLQRVRHQAVSPAGARRRTRAGAPNSQATSDPDSPLQRTATMLVALVHLGTSAGDVRFRGLEHVLESVGAAVVPVLGKAWFNDQQPPVRIVGSCREPGAERLTATTAGHRDGSCTMMPIPAAGDRRSAPAGR